MPDNVTEIHVLLLNYLKYEETIQCVENLRCQEEVSLNFVIVDNCSPNSSFKYLCQYFSGVDDVTVIQSEENGGYASGNNVGLKYLIGRCDFVLICNSDIEVGDRKLVKKLADFTKTCADCAAVAPLLYTGDQPARFSAWAIPSFWEDLAASTRLSSLIFGGHKSYDVTHSDGALLPVECVSGAFFLINFQIFKDFGFFDENTFLYSEEVILARKVKASRFQNYVAPGLIVHHVNSSVISSVLSASRAQRHAVDSKFYYHTVYGGVPSAVATSFSCYIQFG